MKKFLTENGTITEENKNLLLDFTAGLSTIMETDEVSDMSENELLILGTNLHKIVSDAISNRISRKLQIENKLQKMTNEEFETYLKNKYGDNWRWVSLSPEEYARLVPISLAQIEKARQEGAEQYKAVMAATGNHIPHSGLRFK